MSMNSHYILPEVYEKRNPKLNILFKEYYQFLEDNIHSKKTIGSSAYIQNYYAGTRRDIPYSPFMTSVGELFMSSDNKMIECDNNKTSIYTQQEIEEYNLPITDSMSYQNIDFLLLMIPILLRNTAKKDVLKFLFEFYLDELIEIREGHEYLGSLDNNYTLDDPRIKFRDDKVFQTFSYIIFHKASNVSNSWIYKNIIPLSKTMGIHIELVEVNSDETVEYFDNTSMRCNKTVDSSYSVSNQDEFFKLTYDDCHNCMI